MQRILIVIIPFIITTCLIVYGCGNDNTKIQTANDAAIMKKWGKPLAELSEEKLVIITPHNREIRDEFGHAFILEDALATGKRVEIDWRTLGSSEMLTMLRQMYAKQDSPGFDVAFGGGEINYITMAQEGLLQPTKLHSDVLNNIPQRFGGQQFYDLQHQWIGAAVSSFGFIFNKRILEKQKINIPKRWEDLAAPEMNDMLCLADPTQSGSAAVIYEIIVLSEADWPKGWAKLLAILGNAKKFVDNASIAADAPIQEGLVAVSIDFYGALRVTKAPDILGYQNPIGQSVFSSDPIAILKNAPHLDVAQRFVNFVLSLHGQALWSLQPGQIDGPMENTLGRRPIRRDAYLQYKGKLLPWIENPYEMENEIQIDIEQRQLISEVLRELVKAAAIDNAEGLRMARKKIITTNEATRLEQFNRLPDNVSTLEHVKNVREIFVDKTRLKEIEIFRSDWQQFFRDKYEQINQ